MVEIMKKRRILAITAIFAAAVLIFTYFYIFVGFGQKKMDASDAALRQQYIEAAEKWLGSNESDGSHKPIIDLYNSHTPLAQGYAVKYSDAWCSAFVSAVAIDLGWTDIIPTECGCQRHIQLFQNINRWEEDDRYIPSPGDLIFYSSKGAKSFGGNTGWSDHVGIVVSVQGQYITTIEGNINNQVAYRHILVGDPKIRGYGLPDFASKCN